MPATIWAERSPCRVSGWAPGSGTTSCPAAAESATSSNPDRSADFPVRSNSRNIERLTRVGAASESPESFRGCGLESPRSGLVAVSRCTCAACKRLFLLLSGMDKGQFDRFVQQPEQPLFLRLYAADRLARVAAQGTQFQGCAALGADAGNAEVTQQLTAMSTLGGGGPPGAAHKTTNRPPVRRAARAGAHRTWESRSSHPCFPPELPRRPVETSGPPKAWPPGWLARRRTCRWLNRSRAQRPHRPPASPRNA